MAKRNRSIDELNILGEDGQGKRYRSGFDYREFIENYFDPMAISKKQKRKRIEAATELLDFLLYVLVWCEDNPDKVRGNPNIVRGFKNRYRETIFQYCEPDEYLDKYVEQYISDFVDVTLKHKDGYFTSVERAAINAVNEANTVLNYADYTDAVARGKTKKTWVAEIDDETRQSHRDMNNVTVGIDESFVFDDCQMFFAHDEVNGTAAQCSNCRCSTIYS